VNFVFPNGQEARYVRRSDDYAIVYLSSHNGCNQACRFCHLTQTKQTEMVPTTEAEFIQQAERVLRHYTDEVKAGRQTKVKKFHFNWMARGEPLLNPHLMRQWGHITFKLWGMAQEAGVCEVKFKVSTIMPEALDDGWLRAWVFNAPTLYYSLYSTRPAFRKRWLPKAMPVANALDWLSHNQRLRGEDLVLHWTFIEGENDSHEDMERVLEMVEERQMATRFNLVRYNPYSPVQGQESSEEVLQARFAQIQAGMSLPGSKIVTRVGFDVAASCGMFIPIKKVS